METVASPDFDAALTAFCRETVVALAPDWRAHATLAGANHFILVALILWSGRRSPATAAKLTRILGHYGIAGPRFVRHRVAWLRQSGLVTLTPLADDRRSAAIVPTDALLERLGDWAGAQLAAAAVVHLDLDVAAARRMPGTAAYLVACVDNWGGRRPSALFADTELTAFAQRNAGTYLLLDMAAATATGNRLPGSPRDIATRLHVSREHVRDLLAVARARGWLAGDALSHGFATRLRDWIAAELDWTAATARDAGLTIGAPNASADGARHA